jgi:hypothetical protein
MVRSLVNGKGTRLLGRDTESGFILTALGAKYGLPDNLRSFTAHITESARIALEFRSKRVSKRTLSETAYR